MDAFELLKADHRKVAELFDQLENASGKAKLSVFDQIKTELELHTHIEEKIFYPALEKPSETHDLTLEAYEEHKAVKQLLAELSRARTPNDEWDAKAKVLRENVEHHVDEEENELFDKADDALSDEEIESLGQRMEAEKARQQGARPAPASARKGSKKKGIVSRIAAFVGLGSDASSKQSAPRKRRTAKKSAAKSTKKKPAGKKAAPAKKRSAKSSSSKTTKKRGRKSAAKKSRR